MAAFAEFERELIRERTQAGMEPAKRLGSSIVGRVHFSPTIWADSLNFWPITRIG